MHMVIVVVVVAVVIVHRPGIYLQQNVVFACKWYYELPKEDLCVKTVESMESNTWYCVQCTNSSCRARRRWRDDSRSGKKWPDSAEILWKYRFEFPSRWFWFSLICHWKHLPAVDLKKAALWGYNGNEKTNGPFHPAAFSKCVFFASCVSCRFSADQK